MEDKKIRAHFQSERDYQFFLEVQEGVDVHLNPTEVCYRGQSVSLDPCEGAVEVWQDGERIATYPTFLAFCLGYRFGSQPVIDLFAEIEIG